MLIDWVWDVGVGLAVIVLLYGMSLVLMELARIRLSLGQRTRELLPLWTLLNESESRVKP